VALAVLAVANIVDPFVVAGLSPPQAEPWQGVARVLVYLDGAVLLAEVAAIPALATWVFLPPERRRLALTVVAGVWLVASVTLAALYPSPLVRGVGLQRIYLAADLLGLFVSVVAVVSWARLRKPPTSAHGVAIGLVIIDALILLTPYSPWRGSVFSDRYDVTQLEIVVFFAAFSVAQVILWRFSAR
jgi:hypothetical protein